MYYNFANNSQTHTSTMELDDIFSNGSFEDQEVQVEQPEVETKTEPEVEVATDDNVDIEVDDEEIDFENPDALLDEEEKPTTPTAVEKPSIFEIEAQTIKDRYGFEAKSLDEFMAGLLAESKDAILDSNKEYESVMTALKTKDSFMESFASTLKGKQYGTTIEEKVQYAKDHEDDLESDIADHLKELNEKADKLEAEADEKAKIAKKQRVAAITENAEKRKAQVREYLKKEKILGQKAKETSFDKYFDNNAALLRQHLNKVLNDPQAAIDFILRNAPEYENVRKKHFKFEIERKKAVEKAANTKINVGSGNANNDEMVYDNSIIGL